MPGNSDIESDSEEVSEDFSQTLKEFDEAWQSLDAASRQRIFNAFDNVLPDDNPLAVKIYDPAACKAFKDAFQTRVVPQLTNEQNPVVEKMCLAEDLELVALIKKSQLGGELRAHVDKYHQPFITYGGHPDTVKESTGLQMKFHGSKPPSQAVEDHLAASLELAREIVRDTRMKINQWEADNKIPSVYQEILNFHMKAELDSSSKGELAQKIKTLKDNFTKISKGLKDQDLLISDLDGRFQDTPPGWVPDYPGRDKPPIADIDEELVSPYHTIHKVTDGSIVTGNIHISYNMLDPAAKNHPNNALLANILIHEASHKFLNTDDVSYANGNSKRSYGSLDWKDSLKNADSYSMTATCIHQGKLIECPKEIQAINRGPGQKQAHSPNNGRPV